MRLTIGQKLGLAWFLVCDGIVTAAMVLLGHEKATREVLENIVSMGQRMDPRTVAQIIDRTFGVRRGL